MLFFGGPKNNAPHPDPKRATVPGTFALRIEGKDGVFLVSIPCSPSSHDVNQPFFFMGGLQGALVQGPQKWTCCHENRIFLYSRAKEFSFQRVDLSDSLVPASLVVGNAGWLVFAIKGGHLGERIVELIARQRREQAPVFSLVQEDGGEEYLVTIGKGGDVEVSSLDSLLRRIPLFDSSFSQEAGIPIGMEEGAFHLKVWPTVATVEEGVIHVCFSEAGHSEVLSFTYDPTATAPMQALFGVRYWVRYQPMEEGLIFHDIYQ